MLSPKQQVKHLGFRLPNSDGLEINSEVRLVVTSSSVFYVSLPFIEQLHK